jgi:putative FmdB family regulatory protein
MPTYVYRRPDGTTFECVQSINDDALTSCPETGAPVERVIQPGLKPRFNGPGFYETDYKTSSE